MGRGFSNSCVGGSGCSKAGVSVEVDGSTNAGGSTSISDSEEEDSEELEDDSPSNLSCLCLGGVREVRPKRFRWFSLLTRSGLTVGLGSGVVGSVEVEATGCGSSESRVNAGRRPVKFPLLSVNWYSDEFQFQAMYWAG